MYLYAKNIAAPLFVNLQQGVLTMLFACLNGAQEYFSDRSNKIYPQINLFYILKWEKTVVGLIKTYFLSPPTYRVSKYNCLEKCYLLIANGLNIIHYIFE